MLGGEVGLGGGVAYSQNATLAARALAPPREKLRRGALLFSLYWSLLALGGFALLRHLHPEDTLVWAALLVGLVIGIFAFFLTGQERHNAEASRRYRKAKAEWDRRWYCAQCTYAADEAEFGAASAA